MIGSLVVIHPCSEPFVTEQRFTHSWQCCCDVSQTSVHPIECQGSEKRFGLVLPSLSVVVVINVDIFLVKLSLTNNPTASIAGRTQSWRYSKDTDIFDLDMSIERGA